MIIGFYKLFLLVGGAIITTQIVTLLTRRENLKVHITINALDPHFLFLNKKNVVTSKFKVEDTCLCDIRSCFFFSCQISDLSPTNVHVSYSSSRYVYVNLNEMF